MRGASTDPLLAPDKESESLADKTKKFFKMTLPAVFPSRNELENWDYTWHLTKDDAKRVWTEWWGRWGERRTQDERERASTEAWERDNYVQGNKSRSNSTRFQIKFEDLDIGNVYKIEADRITLLFPHRIARYFKITAIGTKVWDAGFGRPTRHADPGGGEALETTLIIPAHNKYFSLVYKCILTNEPDGSGGTEVFLKFKYYNGEGGEERSEQEKAVGADGGWFYYNDASGFF